MNKKEKKEYLNSSVADIERQIKDAKVEIASQRSSVDEVIGRIEKKVEQLELVKEALTTMKL